MISQINYNCRQQMYVRLAISAVFTITFSIVCFGQEVCNDGIDNDQDGFVDYYDEDCPCDDELFNAQCEQVCQIVSDPIDSIRMKLIWASETINIGDDMQAHRPNLTVNGYASEIYVGGEALINGDETNGIITINATDGTFKSFIAGDSTTSMKWAHIAVGEVDQDSNVDFFRANSQLGLSRYSRDGTEVWRYNSALSRPRYPKLGDIDQDGIAEVYVGNRILNAVSGELLFARTGSSGCNPHASLGTCITVSSIMGDFTSSSGLELACGNVVHEFDTWSTSGLNISNAIQAPAPVLDGITGFADVNNDGKTDVIVVRSNLQDGEVWVWNADDEELIASGPSGENGGSPLVTDLDNNCLADIIVVFRNELVIYEYDGSTDLQVKSRISIADNSGYTGCTAFDLNQDGIMEIIHRDQEALRIIDGVSLEVIDSYQLFSVTGFENPIVADIDGDGQAEILTSGYTNLSNPDSIRVFCFESANKPWASARRVWNQTGYHVTNVNNDLTIPQYQQSTTAFFETDSCLVETCPQVYNNFGVQATYRTQQGCQVYPEGTDIALSVLDYICEGDSTIYCLSIEQLSDVNVIPDCISISWYFDSLHVDSFQESFIYCFDRDATGRLITDSIKIKVARSVTAYQRIYWATNDIGTLPGDWNFDSTDILECDYANNIDSIFYTITLVCRQPYTWTLDDSCDYHVTVDTVLFGEVCLGPYELSIRYDSMGIWVELDSTTLSNSGTYILEVSYPNFGSCWTSVTIVNPFAPPSFDLGPDIIRCFNEPILLTAPSGPFTYLWSDTSTDSTFTVDEDGEYFVEVMGRCGALESDTIVITADTASQVSIIPQTQLCLGSELSLSVDPPADSLVWYIDEELACADCPSIDIVADSSFTISLSAWLDGCFSVDTLAIVPSSLWSDTLELLLCAGDTLWLADTPVTVPGTYATEFIDNQGCDSTLFYLVAFAEYPIFDLPTDTLVEIGSTLKYNIVLPPEVSITAVERSSFEGVFAFSGIFEIVATDQLETITLVFVIDDCEFEHHFAILTEQSVCFADVPNIFSPNADNINETWSLELIDCPTTSVKIYDRWGNLVADFQNDPRPSWDGTMKGKPVADGVYVYVISYVDSNGAAQMVAGDITVLR